MYFEIAGFSSDELYKIIQPKVEAAGFVLDFSWADPETDGEFMGFEYEYKGAKPLLVQDFADLVKDLAKVPINSAEIPPYRFSLAPPRTES